jgi:phage terminase large subunit
MPATPPAVAMAAPLSAAIARYQVEPVAYVEDITLRGSLCQTGYRRCRHQQTDPRCQRRRTSTGELIEVRPEQARVLDAIAARPRVAFRAANGVGKDTLTAWAIEWFLVTHHLARIPIISPTGRQVRRTIFAELSTWLKTSLARDKLDILLTNEVRHRASPQEWWALGFSPQTDARDPTGHIEGIHAEHLLMILTEAKAVERGVWDAAERMATRPGNKVFVQSVPGGASGPFYECFTAKGHIWHGMQFASASITLDAAGTATCVPTTPLVSRESIETKLAEGVDSPNFRAGVLAEFLPNDPKALIPLAWVDAAMARWRALRDAGLLASLTPTHVAMDLGFGGSDKTSLARRCEWTVIGLERPPGDTMHAAGLALLAHQAGAMVVVDAIGASGVVDRLKELRVPVVPFVAGAGTDALDRTGEIGFLNMRAAAWWGLRELLDPQRGRGLALPDDALLRADLTEPRWMLTSTGRIQVESKDQIRRRLQRSTDDGDAVVMAFAAELVRGTALSLSVSIAPSEGTYHAARPGPDQGGVWQRNGGGGGTNGHANGSRRSVWGR